MNHFKVHFSIQSCIAIVCGVLAVTVYGLIFVSFIQAFIGVYQTIVALVIFGFYHNYPEKIKKHLNVYAVIWLINALLVYMLFGTDSRFLEGDNIIVLILFFLIPWSSAVYFITILNKLSKWKEEQLTIV